MTPQATRKALVVDDDVAIRQLVSKVLEREQFVVDRAGDGADAIDKLQYNEYNLVLLDLNMPRVDGYEVLQYIHDARPQELSRVIVMTALNPHEVTSAVATVLKKPLDVDELIDHARKTDS